MSPAPALVAQRLAGLRVSAASALVWHAGGLCLVADDNRLLHCYDLDGGFRAEHVLLDEQWPQEPTARKAIKADFEMLCQLPDGWLLALGSGSTAQRRRGVLWRPGETRIIDLTPLYLVLEQQIPQLNLEGAVVRGGQLLLAQRGNGAGSSNALLSLDLSRVMAQLGQAWLGPECLQESVPLQLGQLGGVPLTITDLCLDLQGRLLFSAAAEDSASTYADGPCLGSAIGWLEAGQVRALWPLAGDAKIEGLCMVGDGSLRLVNDPDDAAARSCLYRLCLPDY
ncbi:DUF6929 family protein [Pseudomonas sp. N040]|uniref:DUF6929 family protein n=1 Tax=Pseudomonas sp. N040 TaxID=2785325 RepID=UPI0018A29A44|nr:hypothetical protein [Pseudomonas sp. N040]MBF7730010.1 hypothetical protein [Pseudomonas sp. N040]MBW7013652.1 hypothetical protein [Pseudomonas sp. N040]